MSKNVLILSSREDVHAVRVEQALRRLNCGVRFWNFEPFVHDCQLNFLISDQLNSFELTLDDGPIDIRSFDSIWYRRPGALKTKKFFDAWVSELLITEARQGLMGMLNATPCVWVNHPARDSTAALKLLQLQVAKNAGLHIPETIVTNNPGIARDFHYKHGGCVVYKLISEQSNFALPRFEFPHGIPTLPLRTTDLEHLDQVAHGPHLFQQRIQKVSDIRVTVIGAKIFATQIESQKGSGQLDWRNDYSVPMHELNMPEDIQSACLDVLRALGLNYGAFDFCLDENGRYVFLEVNPAGQYLWVEERTNQPLSQEMAMLLAGERAPLVDYESAAFGKRTHP